MAFPEPLLSISSLTAGEWSLITCTIPDAFPYHMFNIWLMVGEKIVATIDDSLLYSIDDPSAVKDIIVSHNLKLTDSYEAEEVTCKAELQLEGEDEDESIIRNKTMQLNLLYPPEKAEITVYPGTNVNAADDISLSCTYQSRSPANVTWMKVDNGKTLVLAHDQDIVRIPNAEPEDSGVYICSVQNNVGITSSQVQINVRALPDTPKLTIHPTTTVKAGQPVTIECLPNGNQNVNITLWKELNGGDTPLLGANGKLVIKEAAPIDAAIYKCIAENFYGASDISQSLKVEYPPMETTFISSVKEVNEGGEVTLTCTSDGVPEPSFYLYHLLPSGHSILLYEGPEITLTNVTNGVYQCEARNSLGSRKEKLELRVRLPPRNTYLTITPSLVMTEGESVHVRCTSEAYPTPSLVLKKQTETGLVVVEAENGQYSITNLTEEHAGTYVCEASNVVGQQEAKATVTVQVPPKNTVLTISPSPELTEGDSGYVRCTSEAFPAPRLVLRKETKAGLSELEMEDGVYSITQAGEEDAGTYICESTNVAGQQTAETTLIVQAPPKNTLISIIPYSVVKEGEDVQIQCISEGYPDPKLALLLKTEHGLISRLESDDGLYNITNVGEKNMGTYICESTNVAGQQTAEATLTVQIRPRNATNVTPSQSITAGVTVTITYDINTPSGQKQISGFDYVPPVIIGSVVLGTAGFIGTIAYYLKQSKVQGSYSLVNALRSKV